jgi:hypothetical protein
LGKQIEWFTTPHRVQKLSLVMQQIGQPFAEGSSLARLFHLSSYTTSTGPVLLFHGMNLRRFGSSYHPLAPMAARPRCPARGLANSTTDRILNVVPAGGSTFGVFVFMRWPYQRRPTEPIERGLRERPPRSTGPSVPFSLVQKSFGSPINV